MYDFGPSVSDFLVKRQKKLQNAQNEYFVGIVVKILYFSFKDSTEAKLTDYHFQVILFLVENIF